MIKKNQEPIADMTYMKAAPSLPKKISFTVLNFLETRNSISEIKSNS